MFDPSTVNLEFFKKEAKTLLRQCRSGHSDAIGLMRARLSHLANVDDAAVATGIKLADVQHALALERGYASWAGLKQSARQYGIADFSKPGSLGELPGDFAPWRWAVSYTVRPELLSSLVCGKEYVIGVSVLRRRPDDVGFAGYADLYERASTIVATRALQLTCSNDCHSLHTRVLGHTWFRHGATDLVRAAVTLGVSCLKDGDVGPKGESNPTPEALAVPGGMTVEQAQQLAASRTKKGFDEIYSDGDVRPESDRSGIFTFSYGEYVRTLEQIDYKALIKRAEDLTRFHMGSHSKSESGEELDIVKREWFCAATPDIAVIHIYVQRR